MAAEVALRRAVPTDRAALQALYDEHLALLSEFVDGVDPGATLQEAWFTDVERLHAFLVEEAGRAVGFLLVLGREYAAATGEGVDHDLYELFVAEDARRRGVGRAAVHRVVATLGGRWSVRCAPRNERALAFWTSVLAGQPGLEISDEGPFRALRFDT